MACDGDVLRQIRTSTIRSDAVRKQKWLVRLSKSKQDYVRRLEAQPERFLDSLDALIPFAGLWPAIQIGTFPRLLNLHCSEVWRASDLVPLRVLTDTQEMTRYLRRVKEMWTSIIGENDGKRLLIDPNTVYLLQGRCPGLSSEDRAFVTWEYSQATYSLRSKPRTTDQRSSTAYVRLMKHVIVSIRTLLEDTKYLEPCTRVLKTLLLSKSKGSLSHHFSALHSGQPNVRVQTSEFASEDRTLSSGSQASWVSYRQLWLFALHHFPVMDGQAPRKDIGKQDTWRPRLESRWWVKLSSLALQNGYRRIHQMYRDRKAADMSTTEGCVWRILPPRLYNVDEGLMHRKAILKYMKSLAKLRALTWRLPHPS